MTSLPVKDPIKAFAFYTEIMGFKEHTYMPEAQLAIVVSPEDEQGTTLILEPIDELYGNFQKQIYNKGLPYMIFGVDDCQKTYEELKEKGVKFSKEPKKTDWGTLATLDDTCGNFVQIHQKP